MESMENTIRNIFASEVNFEMYHVPLHNGIRAFLSRFYHKNQKNLPLVFLSEKAYESLISSEVMYYQPPVEITIEDNRKYVFVKTREEYPASISYYQIYVIKKECRGLYSVRGYLANDGHCFAPNEIDKEGLKEFLDDACIAYYYQNVRFDYPLYIE